MLQLQPKLAELKGKGVDLYVVAVGNEADLKKFFFDNEIEATILHDASMEVVQQYEVSAIPHTFFVDKAGKIAYDSIGWTEESLDGKFLPVLNKLLGE